MEWCPCLRIDEDGRKVGLQSCWCPFPHNLCFMKANIAAWNERGDRMRDSFLDEIRQRGLRLEKQGCRCGKLVRWLRVNSRPSIHHP